jgi:hypothetical protein
MQKLISQVNSTAHEEIRPRYMLVLSNPNDWQKIENGLMIEYSGISPYLVAFQRISDNIAYTYCGANYQPIMHALYKVFRHKEFFLAEIQPLIL